MAIRTPHVRGPAVGSGGPRRTPDEARTRSGRGTRREPPRQSRRRQCQPRGRALFRVASVYAAWESPTADHRVIYADASAHRLLSDLAPLVTGRPRVDGPLIVAGDLNVLYGYGEYGTPTGSAGMRPCSSGPRRWDWCSSDPSRRMADRPTRGRTSSRLRAGTFRPSITADSDLKPRPVSSTSSSPPIHRRSGDRHGSERAREVGRERPLPSPDHRRRVRRSLGTHGVDLWAVGRGIRAPEPVVNRPVERGPRGTASRSRSSDERPPPHRSFYAPTVAYNPTVGDPIASRSGGSSAAGFCPLSMTEMLMAGSLLMLALGGWVVWLGWPGPHGSSSGTGPCAGSSAQTDQRPIRDHLPRRRNHLPGHRLALLAQCHASHRDLSRATGKAVR